MTGSVTAAHAGAPLVSVVIPTFRRPELLQRCLEAVLAQRLGASDGFEVIVVDDGHEDAVRARVDDLARTHGDGRTTVRCLRPAHGRGPAVARNCGWRAGRGEIVAFTDDDTVPQPGWLQEGVAALRANEDWSGLCGRISVPRAHAGLPTDHERMTIGLESVEFATANAFVRRTALERVDGFDERFTRAWREDSDLQFRLMQQVGPVGRSERAVVLHPVRAERWGISLKQQRNAFFDALLFKKHPRLYRTSIRPVPPWNYYLIVALAVAAPALLWAGSKAAATAAAALLALLWLQFAWHRLRHTTRAPAHVAEMLVTSALIPFLSVYWRLRGAVSFRVLFL